MGLFLRKVVHVQAKDNYRVILKTEEGEFEIGSIGVQYHAGSNLDLGHRYRHPDARDRRRGPGQGPRRLHEAVQGRLDQVCLRRGEADGVSGRKAQTRMIKGPSRPPDARALGRSQGAAATAVG